MSYDTCERRWWLKHGKFEMGPKRFMVNMRALNLADYNLGLSGDWSPGGADNVAASMSASPMVKPVLMNSPFQIALGDTVELLNGSSNLVKGRVMHVDAQTFDMNVDQTVSGSNYAHMPDIDTVYMVSFWTGQPDAIVGTLEFGAADVRVKGGGTEQRTTIAHVRMHVLATATATPFVKPTMPLPKPYMTEQEHLAEEALQALDAQGFCSHRVFPDDSLSRAVRATTQCDYCSGRGRYIPFTGPEKDCPKCSGEGTV